MRSHFNVLMTIKGINRKQFKYSWFRIYFEQRLAHQSGRTQLAPLDSLKQKHAPRVCTGARWPLGRPAACCPSHPGTEAPWLHLVHELLHLLHGVVGLQGQCQDPHLLLLLLRHWACLLVFSLKGKDKQKAGLGVISTALFQIRDKQRNADSSLCAQPLLPENNS